MEISSSLWCKTGGVGSSVTKQNYIIDFYFYLVLMHFLLLKYKNGYIFQVNYIRLQSFEFLYYTYLENLIEYDKFHHQ